MEFNNATGWLCSGATPGVFAEDVFRTPSESMACSLALTRTAEKSKDPQDLAGAMKCAPPSAPLLGTS